MPPLKKPSVSDKAKRKLADISTDIVESDSSSSSSSSSSASTSISLVSDSDSGSEGEEDSPVRDEPVLSHAEKRRQKKRKLNSGDVASADVSESPTKSAPKKGKEKKGGKKVDEISEGGDALPKRQNSVWVGNLAYKTTTVTLKTFFEGLEITRIHMPMKAPPSGTGPKVNSGFAYVDFVTPDAKLAAIAMSERNLEGRRLLIKDGDDFKGRPTAATTATTTTDGDGTTTTTTTTEATTSKSGISKTAQKILAAQKQPPGPTLFFGNLGFEATEDSIRQLLEAHRNKPAETPVENDEDKSADGEDEDGDSKAKPRVKKEDKWIRKIRMGTFEDSGKCKGWAFVDFTSTEHATSSLVNPRNHSLDGRKLNVEYASPDAVRRGGGPRESDHKHKGEGSGVGYGGKVRKPKSAGYIRNKPKSEAGKLTKDGERKLNKKERKLEKKERKLEKLKHKFVVERADGGGRRPGGDPPGKRERPKPGEALALAQRGTAAILPSQGQKITF